MLWTASGPVASPYRSTRRIKRSASRTATQRRRMRIRILGIVLLSSVVAALILVLTSGSGRQLNSTNIVNKQKKKSPSSSSSFKGWIPRNKQQQPRLPPIQEEIQIKQDTTTATTSDATNANEITTKRTFWRPFRGRPKGSIPKSPPAESHDTNQQQQHQRQQHSKKTSSRSQPKSNARTNKTQKKRAHSSAATTTTAIPPQTSSSSNIAATHHPQQPDAVIVGSGLAGLTVALRMLDRGGSVLVLEKEPHLGGNSNKASSGINSCCARSKNDTTTTTMMQQQEQEEGDSLTMFQHDTWQSAMGGHAQEELVRVLTNHSVSVKLWLQERLRVDLSLRSRLGGHSHARTFRPRDGGMVGATLMVALQRAIRAYQQEPHEDKGDDDEESDGRRVDILTNARVTKLLQDDHGRVVGVEYHKSASEKESKGNHKRGTPVLLYARNVVLATGGFASDRRSSSLLAQYRPELLHMPATAGPFSTGDGILLAQPLGAATVDMDKIQLHPTGFVDRHFGTNNNTVDSTSSSSSSSSSSLLSQIGTSTLAAEVLRGVGGILLNSEGRRFCNELGTRDYVTDRMLSHDAHYNATKRWNVNHTAAVPTFTLLLSEGAAAQASKHVDMYTHKQLLERCTGLKGVAEYMNVSVSVLKRTLTNYQEAAAVGVDEFGKTAFVGMPTNSWEHDDEEAVFYAGTVTPVLHYCMGGLQMDAWGRVLSSKENSTSSVIPGLYAVGEVTGGVHGNNRLGGNSLLECAVFGSIVGSNLDIQEPKKIPMVLLGTKDGGKHAPKHKRIKDVAREELQQHGSVDDCWVALFGKVYDLTQFAKQDHPGGTLSITNLAGTDGTSIFRGVHSRDMLEMFQDELVGRLLEQDETFTETIRQDEEDRVVSLSELRQHRSDDDCWLALHGDVYDLTDFADIHPGGSTVIHQYAGTDATEPFGAVKHTTAFLNLVRNHRIGRFSDSEEALVVNQKGIS